MRDAGVARRALAGAWILTLGLPAPLHAQAAAGAPTRTAPATFLVAAYDVSGVTSLDAESIGDAVYPFVGPDRSTSDVEQARKALQDAYAAHGFESVQVEIPPQPEASFAKGIVQLSVIEAPVGKVTVSGSRFHAVTVVRDQVASVEEGRPLNLKTLAGELEAANRFPDRAITPSFAAGKVPGTIDVDLKIEDSLPLHASVEITNDHSPNTQPLRLNAGLRYTNLWQRGHTLSATYIVAPQDRSQTEVFSGSYSAPLLGTPLTLVLYGYHSNSNVAALGGVSVLGKGYQIGGRAVYRLPNKTILQNLTLGLDYKAFDQNITVKGDAAGTAPIKYIPIYASYGLSRATDRSQLDLTLAATAGLRAIRKIGCFQPKPTDTCLATDQFKNKDFDSVENFVHGNLDLTYSHALRHDFTAALRIAAQLADSHLVTNEQVSIGGLASVRGYLQSESVGDSGYSGALELRSPSAAARFGRLIDELRLFAFADGGQVHILHPLAEQISGYSLVALGGGARIRAFKTLSGELAVGVPLIDGPATPRGTLRTTFTAKGEF